MTQINLIVNSLPRDLSEFIFFVIVGYTAGTVGIIWNPDHNEFNNKSIFNICFFRCSNFRQN